MSFEPDRRFIAVGCREHATHVWDTVRGKLLAELPSVTQVDGDQFAFPTVSAAGDRAAIARGNTVEMYALPDGKLIRTITHAAAVSTVAFASAGHDLVSGSVDGSVLITRDNREPVALSSLPGGIDVAGLLPDGRVVVTSASRRLRVYDPDRNAVLAELTTASRVQLLRPSAGGSRLITIPNYVAPAAAELWNLENYQLISQLDGHVGKVLSGRFVDGDRKVLTAGDDGTARMWDGATGRLSQIFRGSSRFLADALLAPDGSMVVAGDADGVLRFWDASNGRPLWTLQAHKSPVIGIHFDGEDIVTRSFAGEISRWTLPKSQLVIADYCRGETTIADHKACGTVPP